jgi:hypothetical protein
MDTYHKYLKYKKKYLKLKNELFGGMETAEPSQPTKLISRISYFTEHDLDKYKDRIKKTIYKCKIPDHECKLAFIHPINGDISEDRILAERNVRLEAFFNKQKFDKRDRVEYICKTCKKKCELATLSNVSDSSQLMDSGDSYNKRHSDTDPELLLSSKKPRSIASSSQESAAVASLSQESAVASSSQESIAASSSQELSDSSSLRDVSVVNLTEDDDEITASATSQKSCAVIDLTTDPDSMELQKVCSAIDLTQPELKTVRGIDWAVLISECRDIEARRDAKNALRNIDPFDVSQKPPWKDKKIKEIKEKCYYAWTPISEEDLCIINRYKEEHGKEPLQLIIKCSKGQICHKQLHFRHAKSFRDYINADVYAINIACKEGHYGELKYFCIKHTS